MRHSTWSGNTTSTAHTLVAAEWSIHSQWATVKCAAIPTLRLLCTHHPTCRRGLSMLPTCSHRTHTERVPTSTPQCLPTTPQKATTSSCFNARVAVRMASCRWPLLPCHGVLLFPTEPFSRRRTRGQGLHKEESGSTERQPRQRLT